jgi:hypothetical protein
VAGVDLRITQARILSMEKSGTTRAQEGSREIRALNNGPIESRTTEIRLSKRGSTKLTVRQIRVGQRHTRKVNSVERYLVANNGFNGERDARKLTSEEHSSGIGRGLQ